jgi:hypothetical protein
MLNEEKPWAAWQAPRASHSDDGGGEAAVCVMNCNTTPQTLSIWKASIVDVLSEVFEVEPELASTGAHIIQMRCPWFRGA